MRIGQQIQDIGAHTYVMGILNVTPDSFSDGGSYRSIDQALFHTEEMIHQGAAIIDVGGESTRPGYHMVSDEEEIERTASVIAEIRKRFDIPISLDTYKSQVASEGLRAGADIINDIWGLQYDEHMGAVVAAADCDYILMHNRRTASDGISLTRYMEELSEDINRTLGYGIKKERIILDPGIGFAKSQEDNLMIMANLNQLQELNYPILLGASRKSVINHVLHVPVGERLEGTLATTAMAVMAHVGIVRVHDVLENVRFIKMLEEMRERKYAADIY